MSSCPTSNKILNKHRCHKCGTDFKQVELGGSSAVKIWTCPKCNPYLFTD